jgi:MFS family permease
VPIALPRLPGAFRHQAFARYWVARVVSVIALQAQAVAVGWQVYDLTGDPFDLGLVGLAQFLPAFLLVLVTGQVVDRFDRRRILIVCQAVECVCAGLLLWTAIDPHPAEGAIFAILLLFGAARAFELPTSQAMLPSLVPREDFRNAVALNSSANQTAIIAGPAIGGLLYAFGPTVVYATCGLLLLGAMGLIALMRYDQAPLEREPVSWKSLIAGLSFMRSRPDMLGAISLDLFAVLLGGITGLLPIFAKDILHVGPTGLGLLRSAPAVGALTTALILAKWPFRRHDGVVMLVAVGIFGIATVVFALSDVFLVSLIALVVTGASDMISVFVRQTLVQLTTPDAMRGRVSAVNAVFIGTSNQLGDFRSGTMAAWLGAPGAVLAGGLGTLAVVALWIRLFPALRKLDGIAPVV